MQEFQQRVIQERNDLISKITKLAEFLLADPTKRHIEEEEIHRMWRQLYVMLEYGKVLTERIANFK